MVSTYSIGAAPLPISYHVLVLCDECEYTLSRVFCLYVRRLGFCLWSALVCDLLPRWLTRFFRKEKCWEGISVTILTRAAWMNTLGL